MTAKVVDSKSGKPVAGAMVYIEWRTTPGPNCGSIFLGHASSGKGRCSRASVTFTDVNGKFSFKEELSTTYGIFKRGEVFVYKWGYEIAKDYFDVAASDIKLNKNNKSIEKKFQDIRKLSIYSTCITKTWGLKYKEQNTASIFIGQLFNDAVKYVSSDKDISFVVKKLCPLLANIRVGEPDYYGDDKVLVAERETKVKDYTQMYLKQCDYRYWNQR